MNRTAFLVISGILALFFGVSMLAAPGQMLRSAAQDTPEARYVLQWMACVLIAVGVMNLLSRRDPGSLALRAVIIGNVLLHVLGMCVDAYQHLQGFVQTSGVIMGLVVHGVLTAGFGYYLVKLPPSRT